MFQTIKSYLLYNANQKNVNSISNKYRNKRNKFFLDYCKLFEKPLKILDIGGSDYHWRNTELKNSKDFHITIVNKENQDIKDFTNLSFIKLDVSRLNFFKDDEYELVYSNSLLEHISNFDEQKKLAGEIRRIGKKYFVQTPNYYFPVEPHFLFPFFQFLPERTKINLIKKYNLGWYEKQTNEIKAEELAKSIRLIKKEELKKLFPDGIIFEEKFLTLTKSFIIYNL